MMTGYSSKNSHEVIIVELKQWDECTEVEKVDGVYKVNTYTGEGLRDVNYPSYQAMTYANLIRDYNANVEDKKINIRPCAYLHNYYFEENDPLLKEQYKEYIKEAPLFDHNDVLKLRNFIKKYIEIGNDMRYDDQLIIMTEDHGEDDVLKSYITIEGNHARGHLNQRQIDVIEKEVIPELSKKVDSKNIGIISPYRKQRDKIQQTVGTDLKIDTVHKFQEREEEAIIITTVDNEITEFVDDPKMLNVAVTRAKKYLRLVVSNNENNKNTNIGDLIRYIKYNKFETIESKTKSIYDLLYKQNRQKRIEVNNFKNINKIYGAIPVLEEFEID